MEQTRQFGHLRPLKTPNRQLDANFRQIKREAMIAKQFSSNTKLQATVSSQINLISISQENFELPRAQNRSYHNEANDNKGFNSTMAIFSPGSSKKETTLPEIP